jgi:hypothetical protein
VLARRSWKVQPGGLPGRPAGGDDADWFLAWRRWRREAGLPDRVFAGLDLAAATGSAATGSAATGSAATGSAAEDVPAGRQAERPAVTPVKPQYVDFDTPFSLSLLNDLVRSAPGRVVFTEMLPDVEQLWLHGAEGRYVTEQTVEVTGIRRTARSIGREAP